MLKKKILGLFIIGLGFLGITNGATDTRWIILDNNNINENQVWTNPVTANGNNGYIITSKGNGNWTITDDGTFNNIWKIANTNRNHQRTYYFWNTGNEIVFSAGNSDGQTNGYNAIKPLKMLKTTPSQFTGLLINPYNDQFTYNISDFYNLTGNFTQLAIGVNIDGDSVYDSNWRYMCITINNTDTYCTACQKQNISLCLGGNEDYLPSSQIYNYSYSDYEQYIGTSPFAGGGTGTGGTEEETGGATLYCPKIKFEIDMYGYKYNTGLCYSNTEEISGGQVTTVTPITIFEAFPTYQNYVQAYNLITNNCHTDTVNTVEQCQEALQGIGKKPSEILLKLINSKIQEGVSLSKIYQYCHLQLDYTEEEKRNKSTCDLKEDGTYYASGVNSTTQSNPNPLQGMTDTLQDSTDIIIPEDGTIFDAILPDGIISWKDVIFDFDFREHLTKLIGKIIILFKVRPIQTGILPPLITSLLLLVILFKIYKK